MKKLYVPIGNLRPGIVLSEDIFVNTINPIIKKDTKVTTELIEVLHAFGIKKVKVKNLVVEKEEQQNKENTIMLNTDETVVEFEDLDLEKEFNEAVKSYKKEFISWQSGTHPDITKVRSIVIPFLEKFKGQKNLLNLIGDYSSLKDYKYHHPIAVGIIAFTISKQMGLPVGQTLQLGLAGVLADCGMAKISESITEKSTSLTKEEFKEVKKHVVYSYKMIQGTPLLRPEMKQAIFEHHERLDGSGYPRGIKSNQISNFSQVLAVADVFHSMISERIYRPKESPFKVIEMIKEEEFGKFNIEVVQALHDIVCKLSIGTKVKLTNGDEGEVIFIHRDAALRPTVKINADQSILDLTTNRHLSIQYIL